MLKVSFQGEHGAYSEQAIKQYFVDKKIQSVPSKSFSEALNHVAEKTVEYVMLPIENSVAGSVIPAYDELLKHNLRIQQEVTLKVEHCLMANKGVDISDIELVRSHPQALSQCEANIKRMGLEPKSFVDTAGAAKYIAEKKTHNQAAIASELAAKTYELDVLSYHFEDESFNHTRFFLLGRKSQQMPFDKALKYKTSIVFATLDKPHALVDVLLCLSDNGINMTKIESRPSRLKAWDCTFFLDFEGHEDDENVQKALLNILKRTSYLKLLGSYQSQLLF
ncbi:prephenate dehydratase [Fangia hongkongensis]|uniref:prephenate dehydratase n=1 Tax=Fangia hongkongensis TaxID=270495 RepID=UPI000366A7BB|nr:prephenate dehydratase [Fangia hongkongensis]MBK2124177.1 prephenate dehydratase [Fangia hongkongensis]